MVLFGDHQEADPVLTRLLAYRDHPWSFFNQNVMVKGIYISVYIVLGDMSSPVMEAEANV